MDLKKNIPYVVAGYVVAVGVFFCLPALNEGALLNPEPPGKHFLLVVSIIFMFSGIYAIYLFNRGNLKNQGSQSPRCVRKL